MIKKVFSHKGDTSTTIAHQHSESESEVSKGGQEDHHARKSRQKLRTSNTQAEAWSESEMIKKIIVP